MPTGGKVECPYARKGSGCWNKKFSENGLQRHINEVREGGGMTGQTHADTGLDPGEKKEKKKCSKDRETGRRINRCGMDYCQCFDEEEDKDEDEGPKKEDRKRVRRESIDEDFIPGKGMFYLYQALCLLCFFM